MSDTNMGDVKVQESTENALGGGQGNVDLSGEEPQHADKNEESPMPSPQQEEEIIKKKYGGMIPKKPPLISKDHEHAFFDSADWALGKQGAQKPKGPLEALRPKLQPTPQQQVRSRRSAYAPSEDNEDHDETGSPTHTYMLHAWAVMKLLSMCGHTLSNIDDLEITYPYVDAS
ncbi:uncharacterized protein LOC122077174 isoform X2 [Macadamia integrifolia]|uniref:uncharacterized protein LOC122077174 isoform X2 n=1 Tax=Macadamia integrifolia TaxID=60698 RepID=UPI001C4EF99F|nr:uncharacterized protein LOC122077174 isoform X2 [Macadamia integrifolia]